MSTSSRTLHAGRSCSALIAAPSHWLVTPNEENLKAGAEMATK
jgi:hypothetical protein